jgi:hypothetical protein
MRLDVNVHRRASGVMSLVSLASYRQATVKLPSSYRQATVKLPSSYRQVIVSPTSSTIAERNVELGGCARHQLALGLDAREIAGELGGDGWAVVDGDEAAVVSEKPFALARAPVVDAAGGLFRAYHGDLLGEALGAVPAAQHSPGGDPHGWGDLTNR